MKRKYHDNRRGIFLGKNEQNFKRLYLGTVCFENHLGIMESIRNDCTVF